MRKTIIILLACILSGLTANAQRPTVMGFPLGGQTSYLTQKLRERGYEKTSTGNGEIQSERNYVYRGGTFAGYDAEVFFIERSGFVTTIAAGIECSNKTKAINVFNDLKKRVIEKYGEYYIERNDEDHFSIKQSSDNDEEFWISVSHDYINEGVLKGYRADILYFIKTVPNNGDDDI